MPGNRGLAPIWAMLLTQTTQPVLTKSHSCCSSVTLDKVDDAIDFSDAQNGIVVSVQRVKDAFGKVNAVVELSVPCLGEIVSVMVM